MAKGFSVRSVEIEGFKGFTARKRIDLNGRHVFLLGQNGNGKSSIIEAVRWGLFGSARRPNEIVANQGYGGRCRVDITLVSEGVEWHLRRTLNRGTTGGSDAVLTDAQGAEHPMQQIMPQLDSVDAGEGTHIIFAPQSTPLRRQPEDLTPFERTVFNHLGLTHPRALLGYLGSLNATQELAEKELGEKLTNIRHDIDSEIDDLQRRRSRITSAPPWGGGRLPTLITSEQKARNLIAEITGAQPDEALDGLSLGALIDNAENALNNRHGRDRSGLAEELLKIEGGKEQLDKLIVCLQSLDQREVELQQIERNALAVLNGVTADALRESVNDLQRKAGALALRREMAGRAIQLLELEQEEQVCCPVCAASSVRQTLEDTLHNLIEQLPEDGSPDLEQAEARLEQVNALSMQFLSIKAIVDNLQEAEQESKNQINESGVVELPESVDAVALTGLVSHYTDRANSVRGQIDDSETWFGEKQARLSKMKEEEEYHRIQRGLAELRQSQNKFDRMADSYQNLVDFGQSLRAIRQAVSDTVTERLEADLPEVANNLSQVFAALTSHPWYDRLVIPSALLPKLELRVSTSNDPQVEYPTGVLNGQAESALELVPYFAFSQAEDAPTEVYLVLFDDPTRAFDENHTRILVERLASLGQSVQLMVASHETGRFRELVPENFESGSYVIVEPVNWSHDDGPELQIST